MIPAGTHIFLKIKVAQPSFSLQKASVQNIWTLELNSMGYFRKVVQSAPVVEFVDEGKDFAKNRAVLGKMVYDNFQPTVFKKGERNELYVFFQPEQRTGYRGVLILDGPIGFNLATQPPDRCETSRLPVQFYRKAGSDNPTQYLPIVASCICTCYPRGCPPFTYNRANIGLENSLEPIHKYGFQIRVINAPEYVEGHENQWRLLTTDSGGNKLDASYPTLRFNPALGGTSRAWGLYDDEGDTSTVQLSFSTLVPTAAVGGSLASVTIFPIQVLRDFTGSVRLVAPDGYSLTPQDFDYHYALIPGATASWPGQVPWQAAQANPGVSSSYPDQAKNVLIWESSSYKASEKYGFTTKLELPQHGPSSTSDAFFLQFGWDSVNPNERMQVMRLPLPRVQSIINTAIGYSTNVAGATNMITIQFDTAAEIPLTGEVVILTPDSFVFEEKCFPLSLTGHEPFPEEFDCQAVPTRAPDGSIASTTIGIKPQRIPFPVRRFVFQLKAINPPEPRTNRSGQDTECSYQQCWTVKALDERGGDIDLASSAVGFAVNRQMLEAKLLDIDGEKRLATGRNDRPGRQNNLIYGFKLAKRPSSVGHIVLKGPAGFVFDEDCLPGLRINDDVTNPDSSVFGSLPWIEEYARWDQAAQVRSCVGGSNVATMRVELGLHAEVMYVFRIRVAANPTSAPMPNLWTIDYSSESSLPFEGFALWSFTEYNINLVTTASITDTSQVSNPVTIRFRPYKEVDVNLPQVGDGGMLRVIAPSGFVAVPGTSDTVCATFELMGGDGQLFTSEEARCRIDEQNAGQMDITLTGQKKLEAGKLYILTVQVYNPRATDAGVGVWIVDTFNDILATQQNALDSTAITGYPINMPLMTWSVTVPPGDQHAGYPVPVVSFEMRFPYILDFESTIEIEAPKGFILAAPQECIPKFGLVVGGGREGVGFSDSLLECAERIWKQFPDASAASWNIIDTRCFVHRNIQALTICGDVPEISNATNTTTTTTTTVTTGDEACIDVQYQVCGFATATRECHGFTYSDLPINNRLSKTPVCESGFMRWAVTPEDDIATTRPIMFTLSTRNPAKTPSLETNVWRITHRNKDNSIASSHSAWSWQIIPELQNVKIRLTGIDKAAGSTSELSVSFVPHSNADEVTLRVVSPEGFDFRAASIPEVADDGSARSIIRGSEGMITVRIMLVAGVLLDPPLAISGVRLPETPGKTIFDITTSEINITRDELLGVSEAGAFVLPGLIEVSGQQLQTLYAHESGPLNATAQPKRAGFRPRSNDDALATFTLRFGANVPEDATLSIEALPFSFKEGLFFAMTEVGSEEEMKEIGPRTILNDGARLEVHLLEPLFVGVEYKVQFETFTGPDIDNNERWRFETHLNPDLATRLGYAVVPNEPLLPINTNDAQTASFELVAVMTLSIDAPRVAPRSDSILSIVIGPGGSAPSKVEIYAPVGFTFLPGSCLVGEQTEEANILGCRRTDEHRIVELQIRGEGLLVPANALITVRSPDVQYEIIENTWLIRGLTSDDPSLEVGWGQVSGFRVVQMQQAEIIYGGSATIRVTLAVVFRTTETLLGGGQLVVLLPEVYKLNCQVEEGFNPLNVPGISECNDAGAGLRLTLNSTLAPGDYAFMAGLRNPAYTPANNKFSILLMNKDGNVVDAAMQFQGEQIVQGLSCRPPTLAFSSSQPKAEAEIHMALVVRELLDPSNPIGPVRSIQISVPEYFELVRKMCTGVEGTYDCSVRNLDGLVTPEDGWFHLYFKDRLVRVDTVDTMVSTPVAIPEGTYRVAFYVYLPEFVMPRVNLWKMTLCRDLACTDQISTFPVAGFQFGDEEQIKTSAEGGNDQQTSGSFQSPLSWHWIVWSLMNGILISLRSI
eukprot:gnl/MRDRNA2_/MRDRNA2_77775_c0_seq1.p1 gnl/MRDRNA2_/MRDRNA2_77775_c0~~gnl/MRDRNA2_/MRDRNA2_77775_c0_seq1.p1  ORF type:complete len:2163 (+),score=280.86 gnl/MRDRNA2_/MRDRNA2_77775_c0_seq1:891-6491(+)